jgi:5-methylcytosine-specific restriction endonuclease McrA
LHGIWNETNSNIKYSRGIKQNWILLLTKLNKPISTQILRARDIELQTSYYLSNKFYSEWCTRVKKARMFKKSNNSWIELYKKQKGLCTVCKKPLGYFKEDVLKIHHIIPANKKMDNAELTKISNLKLIHKTCHKTNDACF